MLVDSFIREEHYPTVVSEIKKQLFVRYFGMTEDNAYRRTREEFYIHSASSICLYVHLQAKQSKAK